MRLFDMHDKSNYIIIIYIYCVGVDHDELVKTAQQYFGNLGAGYEGKIPTTETCRFTGSEVRDVDKN